MRKADPQKRKHIWLKLLEMKDKLYGWSSSGPGQQTHFCFNSFLPIRFFREKEPEF